MPRFTLENDTTGLVRHLHNPDVEQYVYPIFIALAWCNSIELIVLCLNTFKRFSGSYFWSLFIASIAIIPFGLGYMLKMFDISFTHHFLELAIVDIGWSAMVTGQSLVLWSRLHLVMDNERLLRGLLYMIIIDSVLLCSACTALEMATTAMPHSSRVSFGFGVMERIQLVWLCVQELIISSLYIVETAKLLRVDTGEKRSRIVLSQLIAVNVVIMLLDVAVVAVQYAGLFTFQVTVKAFVYSIKLKLEYVILGRLVDVAHIRAQATAPRFRV